MTRQQKIAILQAIQSGEAPPDAANGPQMHPVIIQTEPGKYPIGDKVLNEAEFREYCARIERVNRFFSDFQTGRPVVIEIMELPGCEPISE